MKTPRDWLEYQIKELGLEWKEVLSSTGDGTLVCKELTDKDGNRLGLHLCKMDGTLPEKAICPGWALTEYNDKDGLDIFYQNVL